MRWVCVCVCVCACVRARGGGVCVRGGEKRRVWLGLGQFILYNLFYLYFCKPIF